MLFKRLIWASLAVALVVGLMQTGLQQLQAVPIILAAETYEGQKAEAPAPAAAVVADPAHAGHAAHAMSEEAEEWAPADGLERHTWTAIANALHAFSMALLLFAVMGLAQWRGTRLGALPLAAVVAAAGWLVFHFWPSLGLHAEIPGMDAARLGSRQGWWVLAAVSAALACASAAWLRGPWRWALAIALLALPYLVGAPQIVGDPLAGFQGEAQAALRELGQQFVWATTWLSLSFWLCLGLVGGWAFRRWVQPALSAGLNASAERPRAA